MTVVEVMVAEETAAAERVVGEAVGWRAAAGGVAGGEKAVHTGHRIRAAWVAGKVVAARAAAAWAAAWAAATAACAPLEYTWSRPVGS